MRACVFVCVDMRVCVFVHVCMCVHVSNACLKIQVRTNKGVLTCLLVHEHTPILMASYLFSTHITL